MTIKEINYALHSFKNGKGNYAGLVHKLYKLECSDELIKAIVVGAFGEKLEDRVLPLIAMVRAYEHLSSSEQIDLLYSIVNDQDGDLESDALKQRAAG